MDVSDWLGATTLAPEAPAVVDVLFQRVQRGRKGPEWVRGS